MSGVSRSSATRSTLFGVSIFVDFFS